MNKKLLIISNSKSSEKAGGLNSMATFMTRSFSECFITSNTNTRDRHGFDRLTHLIKMMRKIITHEIDIVYFNSIYYFEFLLIAFTCIICRKPYVIHSHGSLSSYVFNEKTLKKILLKPILNICIRRAKFLVFANHSECRNSSFGKMPYVTFRNYIFGNTKEERFREKRNLKKFVFISKIDWKYKGIEELLEAFKIFTKHKECYELSIYGYGDKKVEQTVIDMTDTNIEKLIALIRNQPTINFYGPIYGETKNEVISKAGAVCLFSKTEALPLILTEAISFGTLIMASSATNYGEVLGKSDLICDGTVKGIVELFENYHDTYLSNYCTLSDGLQNCYKNKFSDKFRSEELGQLMAALRRTIANS